MPIRRILQSKISGGSQESNHFLHTPAILVDTISEKIKRVIQDLKDTSQAYPFCVGLSAPQIGEPYAISVINIVQESSAIHLTLINPQILNTSGKKDRKRESCMSVWGETGEVERRDKLIISYQDELLETHQLSCGGFESRVIQHEIDHLNGILYSDKLFRDAQLQHADFFDDFVILDGEIG